MIDYDPHHWLDHFFDIQGSLVKEIGFRVAICGAWAGAVVAFDHFVDPVGMPVALHTIMGLALGLLLVFRTNSSYDRFWEGRKLWGGIVNETRNLVRGGIAHFPQDRELLGRLVMWTAAYPWAVAHSLRSESGLGAMEDIVPDAEREAAIGAQHPPLHVAQHMTSCLVEARDKGYISDFVMMTLDQNVQLLIDYLGGCERIRKTPLPFAYVVHLRRALVLYCFTLPFAIVDLFGWYAIGNTMLVAFVFFGIEEIGVEIEGPFGYDANDLPMEDISATIQRNLYAMSGVKTMAKRI